MTREECMIFLRQVKHVLLRSKSWELTHELIEQSIDMAIEALKTYKTGTWIQQGEPDSDNNLYFVCSNCGAGDMHAVGQNVPYCWQCGARMENKI